MILADKIVELRKKNGWSQEELAEKLEVSRQAVSKWESAQSVPDMNRVLQLSNVFGVSTDYLLRDELGEEPRTGAPLPEDTGKTLRSVSMSEAQDYLRYRRQSAGRISLGVLLCVLSPAALILLAAAQENGMLSPLSEEQAAALGLLPMFLLIGGAVALFILSGLSGKKYDHLRTECFETAYGVNGYVREQRDRNHSAFAVQLIAGVVLCVLSVIPVFVVMLLVGEPREPAEEFYYVVAASMLLCIVAFGVWLIVRAAIIRGGFSVLLEEGDYSRESKQAAGKNKTFSGCYWGLVTAGFLAYSFITGHWNRSWIVWPVAGVLYGAVLAVWTAARK